MFQCWDWNESSGRYMFHTGVGEVCTDILYERRGCIFVINTNVLITEVAEQHNLLVILGL